MAPIGASIDNRNKKGRDTKLLLELKLIEVEVVTQVDVKAEKVEDVALKI